MARTGQVRYRRPMDPTDETRQSADEGAIIEIELSRRSRPRKAPGGLGDMIGNAVVGFDYQVFRATKPPAILVESAKPVRGLSGEGGTMLSIDFPDDNPEAGDMDPAGTSRDQA
jgi:hypothetical protein